MNSQQLTHNAHDAVPPDNLQSSFYSFPELLDSSKVTQAPHSLPSYVQRPYAPDSGASRKDGGSPPLHHHILEQPQQGHPHLDPSPMLQQYQPYPTVAHPPFPHHHEGSFPTPQDISHQLSLPSAHSRMSVSPWPNDHFSDNARTQSAVLRGGISPTHGPLYALRPQPLNHPLPTHRSAPTDAPLEQSQPTTAPGPSTPHEQHQDRVITAQGQLSHSWSSVGSLNPATGVFCQASDHPRIRTAQACEKCRARKAKCSGEHPTCQRCFERGLECQYAAERRMRGPNKPKPLLSMPDGSSQLAVAEGQKTRKRAFTMPTQHRLQIWDQQQRQQQQQKRKQSPSQQQKGQAVIAAAAAAPASPASSTGSGSLGYPPLSESEASPMTAHSSLDSRHSSGINFPSSPPVFAQDFSANTRPRVLSHVSEGSRYGQSGDHDGVGARESMAAGLGAYWQDVFPDLSLPFDNPPTF